MRAPLIALALLASSALAQEVWVDAATGNDTNSGAAATPLQSISEALRRVTPNSTVYVRAGIYSLLTTNEQFPLNLGTALAHDGITLYGFDGAVLDFGNSSGTGIQVGLQANGARITGFTLVNMDKTAWWARAISAGTYNGAGAAPNIEIDRCRFVDVNRGIVLWQGAPIVGWQIHDNLFLRLGNDCINEFDTGSANTIHDNTFVTCPQLGVLSDANATTVVNNVFHAMRVGVASSGSPTAAATRVHHNAFWMNTVDTEGAAFPNGLPPGNLVVDPLFQNAAADDYHLLATSPLIDAGDPTPLQRADLDKIAGAVDSDLNGSVLTDIGAYERTPVAVTASGTNGGTLQFSITTTAPTLTVGFVLFAIDEGVIRLPGLSPILLDPATLVVPGFAGPMPFQAVLGMPGVPIGARISLQGFGFDATNGYLVSGAAVRIQF